MSKRAKVTHKPFKSATNLADFNQLKRKCKKLSLSQRYSLLAPPWPSSKSPSKTAASFGQARTSRGNPSSTAARKTYSGGTRILLPTASSTLATPMRSMVKWSRSSAAVKSGPISALASLSNTGRLMRRRAATPGRSGNAMTSVFRPDPTSKRPRTSR